MTPLRQRLIDEMTLRRLGARAVESYIRTVVQLSAQFGRSAQRL